MESRYNHQQEEATLLQQWVEDNIYKPDQHDRPLYSIDTPPPTVSGSLHLGHIFSYTQTDIIARYKRMSGMRVYYPFGFDDNGLATERFVEKQCNVQAHKMPRTEFIALCLEQTGLAEHDFTVLWKRMGLSIDWHYSYSTISNTTRALSQASFIDLYNKGYVYRAAEPALYCGTCHTTIAQAELDDKELPSTFYDIVFKDPHGNDLIVGTTRPELLYSCVALLYHPDDSRYQHLAHQQAYNPLTKETVPIISDEAVVPTKGTGLVMCCTFGDKTDIEWYKKLKLPYKPSLNEHGKFMSHTPLAGLSVHDGRAKIVENLKQAGLVVGEKSITHAVNVHERCKKEIEFLIVWQWFIKILPYKQKLLALADDIEWYPAFMKTRYKNWVENISWDWCISRQRHFGIPFPVWHCRACKHILVALNKDLPIDPQETPYPGGVCSNCSSTDIAPDTDVMDTWNTSSITPYIVLKLWNEKAHYFDQSTARTPLTPMSMRPQAHDIIRTWAFYTIAKAWMHDNTIPWKSIVISGHVLSGHNEKLSKSRENSATSPQQLLNTYPADAIRYWTASGSLGHDTAFSDTQIRIGVKLVTKLWNAFRFITTHVDASLKTPNELGTVNEWILTELTHCFDRYEHYFAHYEFSLALDQIERFFWQEFCDTYLELIKHQLFNPQEYQDEMVAATKWTLYHVGIRILQLYAPYIPYVTDAIYQKLYKTSLHEKSIHRTTFASQQTPYTFEHSVTIMRSIKELVGQVRKLKSEHQLPLNAPLALLTIITPTSMIADYVMQHEKLVKGVTHAQHISCEISTGITPGIHTQDDKTTATVFLASGT
jgi:valyl-tRNA synthetase